VVAGRVVERPGGRVGLRPEANEEVVVEQGLILGRDVAHLGVQLCHVLAQILGAHRPTRIEPHDRLAEDDTSLGAAERQHVDTRVDGERPQRSAVAAERGGGVADSRGIHVHEQAVLVRNVADRSHLGGGVKRAEFGGLRERHHAGLRVVRVAACSRSSTHLVGRQLCVSAGEVEQLRTQHALGRARFVHVDVRPVRAHHTLGLLQHRGEREHVGARAAVDEQRAHVATEYFVEHLLGTSRVVIVAVGECMPGVRTNERFDHQGMRTRDIVGSQHPLGRRRHRAGSRRTRHAVHPKIRGGGFVMTKSGDNGRPRCEWCRTPLPQRDGVGRPRRFCTQACRQWDWVARQRASELKLSENELVMTRGELNALRDQIFVLKCAIDDVERDLDPSIDPTTRDFRAALTWLLEAAKPVVAEPLRPSHRP